jgi:antitoxin component YwqK of YwqJK toxin-antitoxin module
MQGQRQWHTWLECEPGKGKSSSGPYQNDMKEGMWTQLDTNGLVESVYTWHEGKKHGKYFEYDTTWPPK